MTMYLSLDGTRRDSIEALSIPKIQSINVHLIAL
jgi:hypothetical protein